MKKNIINIIKIIAFLLVFFILYSFLTELKHPEAVDLQNIRGIYSEKKDSLDMVYIGGSASFVYWAPLDAYKNYGIASYDYGANTIQPELYKYMVKEMLKTQDPNLIVIDARAFQYRDVDQPPTAVAYRNVLTGMKLGKNKVDFIRKNVNRFLGEDEASYYSDLDLYHTNKTNSTVKNALRRVTDRYKNKNKGFYFVAKAEPMEKQDFETEEIQPVSDDTTEILNDLIAYLKTVNKNVLFVVSPYIETKEHKANFNYVENIIEDAGFDFLDSNEYAKEMNLNYSVDFYNENHVNYYGADKYTNFLAKFIKSKYEIPDRRNDNNYSDWNNIMSDWENNVLNDKEQINAIIGEESYYSGDKK